MRLASMQTVSLPADDAQEYLFSAITGNLLDGIETLHTTFFCNILCVGRENVRDISGNLAKFVSGGFCS